MSDILKKLDWEFQSENMMGPNSLLMIKEATEGLGLKKGMRVLDLACGRGLSSVYLAGEFGLTVFATDLWIEPTDNCNRFREFGMEDSIVPIYAEAHALPYSREYFDAVFCMDAYHFFGVEEDYLDKHLAPLVKKGGLIVIGVPGLKEEFDRGIPEDIKPFLPEGYNFHSVEWWLNLWRPSKLVKVIKSGEMACHEQAWKDWLTCDNDYARHDVGMMETEKGRYFNTVLLVAERV